MTTGYVYFAFIVKGEGDEAIAEYKIGYSTDPQMRIYNMNTGRSDNIELEFCAPATKEEEKALHERFAKHRIVREWFLDDGEISEFVEDLRDAQFIIEGIRGEDGEDATLSECIMFPNPGRVLNEMIATRAALLNPST